MNLPATHYFLLIYPICLILIGTAFIVAYLRFKAPKYLMWMGVGCIQLSVAFATQTLMTNTQLRLTAPWFAILYIGGVWAVVHGMFLKANAKLNIWISSGLIIAGITLLLYFTYIDENLWSRVVIVSVVVLCLEALALPKVYALFKKTYALEKLLCLSYFFVVIYAFIRALIVIVYLQELQHMTVATTTWWMMLISINVFISLWFAIILSAVAVKEMFTSLNEERLRDPLTKLYNRHGFLEKTKDLFEKKQYGEVYLVMCDIDNFKNINDTWGHVVGDKILYAFADICRFNIREGDIVGRFGGEEFIILLQSPNEEASWVLVERLRKKVEDQIFIHDIKITASFGAAKIETESQFMSALEIADKHLYEAKNSGRNRVCFN
ncbi:GGDEF domain-containing protein [Acinetobacter sp. A1-4-2]|uniref:diguanylate cyclase n=1 Tax=Acinetobacter sp. A1-4-2 TaxID=3156489 RepID=A0AAU7STR3_9GAMM